WGDADEIGTLNLITDQVVREATAVPPLAPTTVDHSGADVAPDRPGLHVTRRSPAYGTAPGSSHRCPAPDQRFRASHGPNPRLAPQVPRPG
ncbi:hypothetical protein ACWCRB_26625, partial [Streptomyces sp. NPDC002156]